MRRTIAILLVSVFLFSAAFAGINTRVIKETTMMDENIIEKTYEFSPPSVKDDGNYMIVSMGGAGNSLYEGYPVLPYKTEVLRFPLGTKFNIETSVGSINEMKLEKKIKPYPTVVQLDGNGKPRIIENKEVYGKNAFYPEKWVEWRATVGLYNGKRMVTLSLFTYPCRYNPQENKIIYTDKVDIKINYEPGSGERSVDNYDLLIIAPDKWLDSLQPLVEHKNSHGIKTKLVGLSEALKENGRDDAEKVKYFIKDGIENDGIKYVMLVGGRHGGILNEKWWVPVRYSHLDDNSKWEASYASDLYFADIYKYEDGNAVFDNWDSNGNGIYAEWSFHGKDILDLNPDIYVGRLACRNEYEVKLMVNKIIEYETSDAANQDWFKRMVVVGGDTFPDPSDIYIEGEIGNQNALDYMKPLGVKPVKLWVSDGSLLANKTPDTAWENVVNAISQGCGFLDFEGHGNPMSWATHPYQDENTWINGLLVSHMPKLSNKGMYPICMVGGCHNSQFNVSILNLLKPGKFYETYYKSEWSPECWGWWIARKIDGGAIASIGCTALGYGAIGDNNHDGIPDCSQQYGGWIDPQFFKKIGYDNATTVGEAHGGAIADYVASFQVMKDPIDCKTVQEWVLLGDPSLKIGGYGS